MRRGVDLAGCGAREEAALHRHRARRLRLRRHRLLRPVLILPAPEAADAAEGRALDRVDDLRPAPARYREVAREDAAATFDVYLAAPDYEIDWRAADAAAVARDCEYVARLARIYPRCCFCRKLTEYHLWQYGQDAAPVKEKGRCCDRCYVRRVLPVRLKAKGYSQEEIDEHVRNERAYLGVVA